MTINDFVIACALDKSPAYFTYDKETMLIIISQENAKAELNDFGEIEPFMEALISHESIHVVIGKMESTVRHLTLLMISRLLWNVTALNFRLH